MKQGDLIVALMLAVDLAGCMAVVAPRPPAPPTTSVNDEVRALVTLINNHRKSIGCPVLSWNSVVARVAQAHSDDMVHADYFSHTNRRGQSSFDRLHAAGIHYVRAAENIAAGQATAREVYDSWMHSSGHRSNIEDCRLRQHGIGFTRGSSSAQFGRVVNAWTHDFVTLQ
ncbi:MAG TPA: CAP domain-containing protein [Longimicrobiales bacterium]